jgi:hypothetical protein
VNRSLDKHRFRVEEMIIVDPNRGIIMVTHDDLFNQKMSNSGTDHV